jgi:hypothetical protein
MFNRRKVSSYPTSINSTEQRLRSNRCKNFAVQFIGFTFMVGVVVGMILLANRAMRIDAIQLCATSGAKDVCDQAAGK